MCYFLQRLNYFLDIMDYIFCNSVTFRIFLVPQIKLLYLFSRLLFGYASFF